MERGKVMKKLTFLGLFLLVSGVCIGNVWGIGMDGEKQHRITGIVPSRSETVYWQEINDSMFAAAEENQVDLSVLYTENNDSYIAMDLNDAVEIAILTEAEAVILPYSKADETTDELLLRARAAGIKVVLIDCDSGHKLRDAYIGIDNKAAGYALGSHVLENLGKNEKVLLTISAVSETKPNIKERVEGFRRAFEEATGRLQISVVHAETELAQIIERENYIKAIDDLGAVVAMSERETITGAQLLAQMGLGNKVGLYGFDQTEETMGLLEEGKLKALIGQKHQQMGSKSIETALQLIEGKEISSDLGSIDYELICGEEGI